MDSLIKKYGQQSLEEKALDKSLDDVLRNNHIIKLLSGIDAEKYEQYLQVLLRAINARSLKVHIRPLRINDTGFQPLSATDFETAYDSGDYIGIRLLNGVQSAAYIHKADFKAWLMSEGEFPLKNSLLANWWPEEILGINKVKVPIHLERDQQCKQWIKENNPDLTMKKEDIRQALSQWAYSNKIKNLWTSDFDGWWKHQEFMPIKKQGHHRPKKINWIIQNNQFNHQFPNFLI